MPPHEIYAKSRVAMATTDAAVVYAESEVVE